MRECVLARVRVCVRACVRACVPVFVCDVNNPFRIIMPSSRRWQEQPSERSLIHTHIHTPPPAPEHTAHQIKTQTSPSALVDKT